MTSHLPGDAPAADAGRRTVPLASSLPGRRLTAVMLLAAAALDLARCGVVVATARHAGLVAAGLAAAALSLWTARACRGAPPAAALGGRTALFYAVRPGLAADGQLPAMPVPKGLCDARRTAPAAFL